MLRTLGGGRRGLGGRVQVQAGPLFGFLAVSPTLPIPWSPTRVATNMADAGPKPQRLKVCSQAGLCTCLYLEKEMATHSSILAWKIPWTKDPGRLQSMGSQRVGHD